MRKGLIAVAVSLALFAALEIDWPYRGAASVSPAPIALAIQAAQSDYDIVLPRTDTGEELHGPVERFAVALPVSRDPGGRAARREDPRRGADGARGLRSRIGRLLTEPDRRISA
jgi:hypothetical protein